MLWLEKGEEKGLSAENTQLSVGFFFDQKLEDKKKLGRGPREQG